MSIYQSVFLFALAALCAVSAKSIIVLNAESLWTKLGWLASLLYGLIAAYEIGFARILPPIIPYGMLTLMVITFVIAGFRDERQAEPWYWPTTTGKTRHERHD